MAKPLLLYNAIYDYTAERFVNLMTEVPEGEDIDLYINSPGGSVFAGWSIIGAMQKRSGKKNITVMGMAASMAAFMILFADKREALNVSQFLLHRADGYVQNEDDQKWLDNINKDLRKQMEARLNMEEFEKVTGVTMDQIFDPKQRINVILNAKQAKSIDLIDKIIKLEPKQAEALNEHFVAFADFEQRSEEPESQRSEEKPDNNINKPKIIKMTREEFQAQHPAVYAAILNDGRDLGVKAERGRVGAFLPFMDCDKDNVVKAIKEGTEFDNSVMAEMMVKLTAHTAKGKIEADKPGKISTEKVGDPKSPEALVIEAEAKQVEDAGKDYVKSYKF